LKFRQQELLSIVLEDNRNRVSRRLPKQDDALMNPKISPTAWDIREDLHGAMVGPRMAILPNRNLVFVVDDDPGMLKGVKRLLREHGYDSVLFPSAEAFRNYGDFDAACCLVLDINLNKESGIDLRHRLTAAGISLPVIYITGNDNPAVRMAALASGCIAYLTKPFAARSLLEPIEKASAGLA
jgi:CheY-like chemotaxis protein